MGKISAELDDGGGWAIRRQSGFSAYQESERPHLQAKQSNRRRSVMARAIVDTLTAREQVWRDVVSQFKASASLRAEQSRARQSQTDEAQGKE